MSAEKKKKNDEQRMLSPRLSLKNEIIKKNETFRKSVVDNYHSKPLISLESIDESLTMQTDVASLLPKITAPMKSLNMRHSMDNRTLGMIRQQSNSTKNLYTSFDPHQFNSVPTDIGSPQPSRDYQKLILTSASAYKYTKDQKLCLPTLIKTIEEDKIKKLMANKTFKRNVNAQIENLTSGPKKVLKEAQFGDKKIRFLESLNKKKMQSTFYQMK